MTNDIERHSPEVWRRTAEALRGGADASAPAVHDSAADGTGAPTRTNRNGAPLLGDSRDLFRPKSSDIPAEPGVYKWRDGEGRVIYVGKAKNLRNRLTSYFQPLYLLHPRTQTMVLTARSLEWTVVGTELESLTLEYTWIKEFDPRFNVQFRDDKTYPYLAVSVGEDVPRVWVTRSRKRRDTRYFGPYAKVWDLRHGLDRLLRTFPVRTCADGVYRKAELTGRPCLLASIGKCSAPCVGRIDAKEHRRMCERLVGVMTGRLGRSYIAQLTRDMKAASAELEFEKAARLRDEIAMLSTVVQQNAVVLDDQVDADVFGFATDEIEASVHAFHVRAGTIRGERNWSVERVDDIDDADLMADLLVRVYSDARDDAATNARPRVTSAAGVDGSAAAKIEERRDAIGSTQRVTATDAASRAHATRERNARQEITGRADLLAPVAPVPREVITPIGLEPSRREELETWLTGLRGGAVTIRVASRGDKKQLMDRANDNAAQALARAKMSRIADIGARTRAMNEVADALGLAEAPLRIECYDISNTVGGAFQVASMVVFEDAVAKKSEYRRFAIRGKDGQGALDDLSALYETLTRWFRHGNIAGDSGESIEAERRAAASTGTGHGPGEKPAEGDGTATGTVVQQNADRHRFAYKPNLVVVDGGRPQAMAAAKALADCGVDDVAVCGLAKRLEEVWVPDDDYPIILKRQSEGMYLLQRVRDESHRFAITYHRQTRRKGALRSALDGIPGVGPAYQKRLLAHFGSVRAIRGASIEELEVVKGIGHAKAQAIHAALHAAGGHDDRADHAEGDAGV